MSKLPVLWYLYPRMDVPMNPVMMLLINLQVVHHWYYKRFLSLVIFTCSQ
jgi:hypothetical protein